MRIINKCNLCNGTGEVEWNSEYLGEPVKLEFEKRDYVAMYNKIKKYIDDNLTTMTGFNQVLYMLDILIEDYFKLKEEHKELHRQYDDNTMKDDYIAQLRLERDMLYDIIDELSIDELVKAK